MMKFHFMLLAIGISLSACTHQKVSSGPSLAIAPQKTTQQKVNAQHNIDEMIARRSNASLYLSAQRAMQDGEYELAIRFLATLTTRTSAAEPKLHLAELWLTLRQPRRAFEITLPLIEQEQTLDISFDDRRNLHFLYARAAALSGESALAERELHQLLAEEPAWENARLLQIQLYMQQQEWQLALKAIDAGLKSLPSPDFYRHQAMIYQHLGQLKKTITSLQHMQQLMPNDPLPVLLQSQLYLSQQNMADAEQILRDYLTEYPDALTVYNALGQILVQSNRLPEAIEIYQLLLVKSGSQAEVHSALGLIYFQTRQFSEAEQQFRQALAQKDNDEYRYYLGASLESLQKLQQAKKEYLAIATTSIHWIDANLRLSSIAFLNKDFSQASAYLKNILTKQPNHADAWVMLSSIYLTQEKYRELIDETKAITELKHIPSRLTINRAMAFEKLKNYEQLDNTLKKLIEAEPNNSEALNFLGYSFAERGVYLDEAKTYIERALTIKPNDGYYLDSLAWVYYRSGQFKLAEETQRQALQYLSDDPVMTEHLGDMLWEQQRYDEAREVWQQAIKLGHESKSSLRKKIGRKP